MERVKGRKPKRLKLARVVLARGGESRENWASRRGRRGGGSEC